MDDLEVIELSDMREILTSILATWFRNHVNFPYWQGQVFQNFGYY